MAVMVMLTLLLCKFARCHTDRQPQGQQETCVLLKDTLARNVWNTIDDFTCDLFFLDTQLTLLSENYVMFQ